MLPVAVFSRPPESQTIMALAHDPLVGDLTVSVTGVRPVLGRNVEFGRLAVHVAGRAPTDN
jgi:hypothetical protein